jgi:hypothetical protein
MANRLKAAITPAVLTWARQTAGFSLAEAARRLKIKEERLAEWEDPNNADAPSIPETRKRRFVSDCVVGPAGLEPATTPL